MTAKYEMEFYRVADRNPPRETTVLARGWGEKKQHYVWAFAEYVVEVAHRGWKDRSHGTRLPEMWLWFEPVEWAYLPHPPPPSDLGERGEKGLECPGAVGSERHPFGHTIVKDSGEKPYHGVFPPPPDRDHRKP